MKNFWKTIKKPVVGLAPMDGVADKAMRHLFAKVSKPDVIFTEQVSVEAIAQAFKEVRNRLEYTKIERPAVAQLSGYDPNYYYPAAKKAIELGFDGLDINLGCPVKALNKKGGRRGAGLIEEYKLVESIVQDVRKAIEETGAVVGLSVKTRLGIKTPNTKKWIGFLAKLPVDAITLHGRTFKQGYSGKADWEEIAQGAQIAKKHGKIFLGNGDVRNREEAQKFSLRYGTDGTLIGRAARGNPWCFSKNKTITKEQRIDTLLTHARYFEKTRKKRGFIEFRKHIGWYLKDFPGAKNLRSRLITVKNLKELEQGLVKYA